MTTQRSFTLTDIDINIVWDALHFALESEDPSITEWLSTEGAKPGNSTMRQTVQEMADRLSSHLD